LWKAVLESKEGSLEICKKISTCEDYVSEKEFLHFCYSQDWIYCPHCEKLAKDLGYLKQPRDWLKERKESDET